MTANNLPAGPITFLFSDIEGSTQLWDRHAQGMRRALARHDDILRAVVAEHGGAVVKMTGDGAYAVFAKAAHAYAAAVALQRRLQNNTWPAIEPDALSVRVGIHSGEAELREGDYHGQAVNTASRLMAAGHGGQVLVSGETLRAAPPPEQFLTRELGRYRLKGISEPLRIVQLNAPGLPDAFPALNAPRTAVHNLPSLPTPFIGREGELAQIAHFLSEPDCRLLTLLGPGGMGKTRLALRTGAVVSDQYDHGVYFVDLQAVSRTEFLGPAITSAIGFPLNGQEDALVQLSRYLQDKRLLLILDNFEQLVPDRGSLFLAALLDAAPPIQLLVTSREALNLQQEWLYYVPGLSLPDTPAAEDAEAESVQLFNERARRVRPEFSAQSERAHVTAICRLVEGVPLALELAASWTRLLTCEQIAAELASSFDLLATDRHNVPDRQQSLRVVFDQTWRHLTEDEQAAFMKLSIFHGGFSYDAARQVAGAPLPLLSTLQDKSLIRWDENGRYRIHELLRQYAARKLAQAPSELETAQERHGRYYIDFLERHEQPLMDGRQVQAVQEIKAELENVRAAWQWALEKLDSDAVRRASYALGNFYQFHSRYAEALRAFEPASTRLYSLAQSRERDLALIGTLMVRSWFYLRFGRLDEITEAMEQSQALHQRHHLQPGPGYVTDPAIMLAFVHLIRGQFDTVVGLAERVRESSERLQQPGNREFAYYLLAQVFMAQGQYDASLANAKQAHAIALEMGDRWFMAYILNNLAELAIIRQDYESARQSCQTSFAIREEFNDLEGMAVALNHLSQIDLRQEDYTQAQRTFERSLQLYQEINDIGGLATSYGGLAYAALALGEFDTARGHYTRALRLAADIWYTAVFPDLLLGIGQLLCRTGHVERGLALFAHVRHDGAASYDAQSRAALLLDSFKLSASPQRFAAAEKAGRQATLETTVKELLIELPLLNLSAAINAAAANDGSAANQALVEPLTPRELEVLSLMAGGLSNQEIADELVLALGTVKYYTRQIYGKLQVNNRVRALAVAQGLGLI